VVSFKSKLVSFLFSHHMREWFAWWRGPHAFSFILDLDVDHLWDP